MTLPDCRYVDLQINGLRGIDFNASSLTDRDWECALQGLREDGTSRFLPTLITDSFPSLERKLAGLARRCESSQNGKDPLAPLAMGIHLEGPFLSSKPGYVGAHPSEFACDADLEMTKRLLEWGQGQIRMVTLAPERDPKAETIRFLADRGVMVAAGHTDADRDALQRAIDAGLSLFTHLGNACPMQMHRHDNIVHRVLSLREQLRVTLIADGCHLPLWLIRSWIEHFGEDRVAIVSDAISAAGLAPGVYALGDRRVAVGTDGVPRSEDGSHFVGSGATLGTMDRLLREALHLGEATRSRLLAGNASRWLLEISKRT